MQETNTYIKLNEEEINETEDLHKINKNDTLLGWNWKNQSVGQGQKYSEETNTVF